MPLRLILILLAMAGAAPGPAMEHPQPFLWWITHPLAKVRPLDPMPNPQVKSVELHAGRNEFEPFQIVLRAKSKDLSGVDIDFSDLRTAGGAEISRNNVTVYLEAFVNSTKPSSSEGGDGLWPDPLIPRVDRYTHESAMPFHLVRRGSNQPLWGGRFCPTRRPSRPVLWLCSSVARGDCPVLRIANPSDRLEIRPPLYRHPQSSFGLNGINLLKQHRGRYTDDKDLPFDNRIVYSRGSTSPDQHSRRQHGAPEVH